MSEVDKGTISGNVKNRFNKPISGVNVMVTGNSPSHHDIAVLTSNDGIYRLDDLIPGEYEILINKDGHNLQTLTTSVERGKISELDFVVD